MPFRRTAYLGHVEAYPHVLRTFSHAGHDGFAVTQISGGTRFPTSLVVVATPDGRLLQSEPPRRIPLKATDEDLFKLASKMTDGREIVSLAPFGWTYPPLVDGLDPEGKPAPEGWEWHSRETVARAVETVMGRLSPLVRAAMRAFEHTACFSWNAFDLASADGEAGERRRAFARANPIVAAPALMRRRSLEAIDRGCDLAEILDAMSPTARIDGPHGADTFAKKAVLALSGLLDRPGEHTDPMAFRGVNTAAMAAEALPPEWLPRTHEAANAFRRVCAFVDPMLGSRAHRGPVDWRFLLSGSKGDWEAYLARLLEALEVPEGERDPVEYLWGIEYRMGEMLNHVLLPLAHRSTGALREIALVPVREGSHRQPDWSLANFQPFAARADMNLPAMLAQAARFKRARSGIFKALLPIVREPTGFGNGYGCPYDLHDDAAVASMLGAWEDVMPRSWRGKTADELVVILDALGERYRDSLATRH